MEAIFKEEKFRTDGGSDDEQAKQCWEDLLKNAEHDIVPQSILHSDKKSIGNKFANGEIDDSMETTNNVIQTFLRQNKTNLTNKDAYQSRTRNWEEEDLKTVRSPRSIAMKP